jgi:acetylornithine deacetylase/succinyl-diaminopimelate desuccinylase family protein
MENIISFQHFVNKRVIFMDLKQKVSQYIDDHNDEMIEFLKKAVSIPSINTGLENGGNEKDVQEWLSESLREYGISFDKWSSDPNNYRPNVVGILNGTGGGRDLILNGHVDVVPVNEPDKWLTDPFNPVIKDSNLYGRGSSDMKGGITAAVWALRALKECGVNLKGNVFLQMMVGEESNEGATIGTTSAIKRGYTAPFAIVAEPTNLEIHIASVSLFFFEIIIPGKAVHVCARNQAIFPQNYGVKCGSEIGVDALEKALPFIDLFYRLERQWNLRWRDKIVGSGGHPTKDQQGVGVFTINPNLIEGGTYLGSMPGYVKLTYSVWHPNSIPPETIWEEIRSKVNALASTDDWLKEHPPVINMPVLQLWKGFDTSEDHIGVKMLKDSVKEVVCHEAVISAFRAVCDATFLSDNGIPSVVFGPGGVNCAVHGDNEYIPLSDVITAAKVYTSFIIDWCG